MFPVFLANKLRKVSIKKLNPFLSKWFINRIKDVRDGQTHEEKKVKEE